MHSRTAKVTPLLGGHPSPPNAIPAPTFWWVRESDSPLYSSQQSISKSIYYSPIVCCRTPTFWWVRESDSTLYSSTDNCYNHVAHLKKLELKKSKAKKTELEKKSSSKKIV